MNWNMYVVIFVIFAVTHYDFLMDFFMYSRLLDFLVFCLGLIVSNVFMITFHVLNLFSSALFSWNRKGVSD